MGDREKRGKTCPYSHKINQNSQGDEIHGKGKKKDNPKFDGRG
jgi:hypothetical protein